MKPKIPDRWIPYKACGKVIDGTRIICFKVPLHKNVQTDNPEITEIWDIPAVLAEIPKLGAVIDLTNTGRYYNPAEFEAAGVLHRKILMPGREIPSDDKVRQFMDAVDEFLGNDCDSLIGVHCTHGLNRTGYMVCRYMKDRLSIPAEDAIKRFEKARGYQIERDIYLASLLDKMLPRPDFEAESNGSRRSDINESQHRNDGPKRNWQGSHPRTRYDSTSRNDDHSENKQDTLTKNQRKHLKRKRRKQERRAVDTRAVSQESRTTSQESRTTSQESRTTSRESRTTSQEGLTKSQEGRTTSQEIRAVHQETRVKKSQQSRGMPKRRKIYNYQ